jgi:hypothetical protein
MAEEGKSRGGWRGSGWRVVGWSLAALLLMLPLATNAPWSASDFLFAGLVIGGVGSAFELAVRMSRSRSYRAAIASAVAAAFLIVWVNAAVGMIGSEDNPLNLMFAGVLAVALVGAVLARFRAEGMIRGMTAAAIAHFAASIVGLFFDVRGGIASASIAVLWLLSAALFARAAREQNPGEASQPR